MNQNQAIMASLPMLASVLANKYGVSVDIGSKDHACTDGKTIFLPTLPITSTEKFTIITRGYIDHEVAHVRFTDHSVVAKARNRVEKFILNALEDYRIEHKMEATYAGCQYNFHKLILELFSGAIYFDFSYPAVDILNWLVLRLRAWDAPEIESRVQAYEREIASNFSPAILQMILPILQEFKGKASCLTTEDCLVYARKIAGLLKNPQKQSPPDANQVTTTPNRDQLPPTTPEDSTNGGEDGTNSVDRATDSAEPSTNSGTTTKESMQKTSSSNQPYSADTFAELFDSHTELPDNFDDTLSKAIGEAKQENQRTHGNSSVSTLGIAVEAPTGKFPPLDATVLTKVERATSALKVRLSGLMQAKSWAVSAPARQGRLNTNALHKVITCDDKLFLQRAEKQKIDTAVHILLDKSGSMYDDITTASASAQAILTAMQVLGVNVAYSAFPFDGYNFAETNIPKNAVCVRPIVKHGEKVRRQGYNIETSGTTPTGMAVMYAVKTLLPLKEKRKCIFLITDGMPNEIEPAKAAVQTAESLGIEVYGIGLTTTAIKDFVRQSVVIRDVNELPEKLFRLMSKILLTN